MGDAGEVWKGRAHFPLISCCVVDWVCGSWCEGGMELGVEGLEVSAGEVAFKVFFDYSMSIPARCLIDIQVWRPEHGSELEE